MPRPLPVPEGVERPRCGDCGRLMVLRENTQWGKFWGCRSFPHCLGKHAAHQRTGAPMGTPADAVTRAARGALHALFDQLWKSGHMSRPAAYGWLRTVMFMTKEEAHISMFTKEQCDRAIAHLEKYLGATPVQSEGKDG